MANAKPKKRPMRSVRSGVKKLKLVKVNQVILSNSQLGNYKLFVKYTYNNIDTDLSFNILVTTKLFYKNTDINIFYDEPTDNYHIDINKKEVNYNYDKNVALSVYGDLEVYGNINIKSVSRDHYYKYNHIDSYTYKIVVIPYK
jgi:hypothetical protein